MDYLEMVNRVEDLLGLTRASTLVSATGETAVLKWMINEAKNDVVFADEWSWLQKEWVVATTPATAITYASSNQDAGVDLTSSGADQQLAQEFATGASPGAFKVGYAELYLKRTGTSLGTLAAVIQTNSSGVPSGTAVSNGTSRSVAISRLGTTYSMVRFYFTTPPSLSASTTYHLVLQATGYTYTNGTTEVIWGVDQSSPGYSDGDFETYDGTTWTAYGTSSDACFIIHASDVYQLDSGVWKIRDARQLDTPTPIVVVPDMVFDDWIPDPTTEGDPYILMIWGQDSSLTTSFRIYHLPGEASEIFVKGYRTIGDMSANTNTPDPMPARLHKLIVQKAYSMALFSSLADDPTLGATIRTEYELELAKAIQKDNQATNKLNVLQPREFERGRRWVKFPAEYEGYN